MRNEQGGGDLDLVETVCLRSHSKDRFCTSLTCSTHPCIDSASPQKIYFCSWNSRSSRERRENVRILYLLADVRYLLLQVLELVRLAVVNLLLFNVFRSVSLARSILLFLFHVSAKSFKWFHHTHGVTAVRRARESWMLAPQEIRPASTAARSEVRGSEKKEREIRDGEKNVWEVRRVEGRKSEKGTYRRNR